MRTTRDVRAPRASRARRPSPPAHRALAQHGAATEEKTRDEPRRAPLCFRPTPVAIAVMVVAIAIAFVTVTRVTSRRVVCACARMTQRHERETTKKRRGEEEVPSLLGLESQQCGAPPRRQHKTKTDTCRAEQPPRARTWARRSRCRRLPRGVDRPLPKKGPHSHTVGTCADEGGR